jgi:CheY-like chemotaxis protein
MLCQPLEERRASPREEGRSILIVDDDQSLLDALAVRLRGQGFSTTTAASGKQALVLAHSEMPRLILLDLCLPDMDGLALCQQLVDDERTSEIPVIIVSGLDQPDIIRRARAAGCQYFVHKPYDPNVLLTLIERAIDEAEQA